MNLDKLKALDKDDLLNLLGLETRRSGVDYLVPGLALFGVGMVIGAGVGLLVAPRSGRELRKEIADRLEDVPEALHALPARANEAMHRVSDQVADKMNDHKPRA